MQRLIWLWMALALGAFACSGESNKSIVAGDECEEALWGETVCGLAPVVVPSSSPLPFGSDVGPAEELPMQDAVLQCKGTFGVFVWAKLEACSYQCKDGLCVEAENPADVLVVGDKVSFPTDSSDPGDGEFGNDNVRDPEDIKPDNGLLCEPGQIACEDDSTKKVCDWFGESWEYKPCEEGQGCDLGYCLDVVCNPWELGGECIGSASYSRCSSSGVKWEEGFCEAPKTCYLGACVELLCPPDEIICKGMTAVQECQLDPETGKHKWVVTETCQGGLCDKGQCVSACEVNLKDNSYLGCDYWAVDLDNVEGGQYEPVAIVVSVPTNETKNAEITFTNMAAVPPQELTPADLKVSDMEIAPGTLKEFTMPSGLDIDGSVLNNKSLRIESSSPVTVHQFNPLNGSNVFTNDASLLLPSNVGGLEYVVMSWPQRTSGFSLRGNAAIVATQDGTTLVKIWPTTAVKGGANVQSMAPNPPTPYEFYMEQGDVLALETDGIQGSDLTGTRILADQKVNVFGGHECANIPLGTNYCDHVEQQLFPVQAWGTHYIADAFTPRNNNQKDVWRIVAGEDNVQVSLNPQVSGPYVLNKGQWVEFYSGTSVEVNATGPVLLGHYLQGSNYSGFQQHPGCSGGTGIGDPAFTLSVPAEQYLGEYIVLTPPKYVQDYVNIIAKNGTAGQITLDGAPLSVALTPVGSSGFGVAQIPVPDGVHTIKSTGDFFGVTAYGYDCDVSYAYPGGLSLKAIQ
jgi:hypothetical protein